MTVLGLYEMEDFVRQDDGLTAGSWNTFCSH
jgi:hypothetical protein